MPDTPQRPPSGGLVAALNVRRNAALGAASGALLAVVAYVVRVLELFGPFAGTRQYPVLGAEGWFLMLAFVLATATALLVATALTLFSAYRRVREM